MNSVTPSKSTLAEFLASYHRYQYFSLPESIIYYITTNPSTPKCYQKMIQSCKYFFIKNLIIIIDKLYFNYYSKLKVFSSGVEINSTTFFRCDVLKLQIYRQELSRNEFLFLSSNVENINLCDTTVKDENGSIVPLEMLIENLLNVKMIFFYDKPSASVVTKNTFQNLLKISHFSNIDKIELRCLQETFDIEIYFAKYAIKNKRTTLFLGFVNSLSDGFKNRLDAVVDEIVSAENQDFKMPLISYNGNERDNYFKMISLYNRC